MTSTPRNLISKLIFAAWITGLCCGCQSAAKGSQDPAFTLLVTAAMEPPASALVDAFNKNIPPEGQIAVRTVTEEEISGILTSGDASAVLQWQEPPAENWSALLGWTGISLAVNPGNPIMNVSSADARGIFSGQMERWEDIGGPPGEIHAFMLDVENPLAGLFETVVLKGGRPAAGAMILPSPDAVPAAIALDALSIGYLMMFHPAPGVKILTVDSIPPGYPGLLTGTYPFRIPLYLRAQEPVAAEILAFAGWAQSVSGQAVLLQLASRE
jgi:ABC-type phosphate transport system substrate-binding protein